MIEFLGNFLGHYTLLRVRPNIVCHQNTASTKCLFIWLNNLLYKSVHHCVCCVTMGTLSAIHLSRYNKNRRCTQGVRVVFFRGERDLVTDTA